MNTFYYIITVLIWGTTWYAITFQLGVVPVEMSVVYRFALAAFIAFCICIPRGRIFRFRLHEHAWIALQGILLYSGAYILQYAAMIHLTSGLIAVVFSTIIAMNIFNGALFMKYPVKGRVVIGALLGLVGITFVFWKDVVQVAAAPEKVLALALALIATYMASLGNITSARNQKRGLPVMETNALGMGYGAVASLLWVLLSGQTFTFEFTTGYIGSMLYLSILGSVLAFYSYLTLLGRVGPDRASYVNVLFPVIALSISTLFEGYVWSSEAVVGIVFILTGNMVVLTTFRPNRKMFSRAERKRAA